MSYPDLRGMAVAEECEARLPQPMWEYPWRVPGKAPGRFGGRLLGVKDRRSQSSELVHPNGSVIAVSQNAPFELTASMSIRVLRRWSAWIRLQQYRLRARREAA